MDFPAFRILSTLLPLALATGLSAQSIYSTSWEYSGEIAVEAFGWSMCNAGDVNGDGYPDVLVAAIDHSDPLATEEEEGKLYLFYGGPDGLSATPVWSYEPNDPLNILGFETAGGDLNGDGYSDIIAGSIQWTGDISEQGKVSLWYGGPDGPGDSPDWEYFGDQELALMGSSVAMEADLNQDGFNDLFVSAKMYDNPEDNEGKIWLFWGSADGPVGPVWSWEPDQEAVIAGFPVNYAGDVNGDGYPDVIIAGTNYAETWTKQGAAWVFHGGPDVPGDTPDWVAYGENKKDVFGHWVDGAGDVNGDGYDDVIIAALGFERSLDLASEGAAYVYLGSADGLQTAYAWRDEGNQSGAQYGYCVSGAGDVNGDGYDEIIVGSKYWSDPEFKEGNTVVYWGSPNGPEPDYCWFSEGGQDSAYLGRHVDGGADFNGDGYDDFLTGAYRYTNILDQDGIVYAIYGGPRETAFHLPADSLCISEEGVAPVLEGLDGGNWTTTEGLVADPLTGSLELTLSEPGTHTLYYTFDNGWCSHTDSATIYLAPEVSAGFSYTTDTVLTNEPTLSVVFDTPDTIGFFNAFPEGLSLDENTGAVDLGSSLPGTYVVSYVTTNGWCSDSTAVSLTVLEPCLPATDLTIADVTPFNAKLSWTYEGNNAVSFDIFFYAEYDTVIILNEPDTSIIADLLFETEYTVWVVTHCAGMLVSGPSDSLVFSTLPWISVDEEQATGLSLYPNPTWNELFLKSIHTPVQSVEIYNLQGQTMGNYNLVEEGNLTQIDLTGLPAGSYLLKVVAGDKHWQSGFLLQR